MCKEKYRELFKTADIAGILGVNVVTVLSEIRKGRLRALKVGSDYRITEQALKEYLGLVANDYKSIREVQLEEENSSLKEKISQYKETLCSIKNELLKL